MIYRLVLILLMQSTSGCALVNTERMKYANDEIEPQWPEQQQQLGFDGLYLGVLRGLLKSLPSKLITLIIKAYSTANI